MAALLGLAWLTTTAAEAFVSGGETSHWDFDQGHTDTSDLDHGYQGHWDTSNLDQVLRYTRDTGIPVTGTRDT